jgi:hypothetical protein
MKTQWDKEKNNTPISKRFVIGCFAYLYPRGRRLKAKHELPDQQDDCFKKFSRCLLDDVVVVVVVTMTTNCFRSTELDSK